MQCFGVYRGVPRLTMKFLLSDATPTFVNFALPLPVTRFVAPLEVDAAEFTEMWNSQELWINEGKSSSSEELVSPRDFEIGE